MRRIAHRETLITYWNVKTYSRQNPNFALIDPPTFHPFSANRRTVTIHISGKYNGRKTIENIKYQIENPPCPLHFLLIEGYFPSILSNSIQVGICRFWIRAEQVTYDDIAPWPVEADGAGKTLQRISETAYGNDAAIIGFGDELAFPVKFEAYAVHSWTLE
jgi:hypothetical protein